jgi:hypothetical protein
MIHAVVIIKVEKYKRTILLNSNSSEVMGKTINGIKKNIRKYPA